MAKTTIDAFAKFNDLLDKKVKSKIELKSFSDVDDYTDTGNYLLNAQISGSLFGGYPNTRSVSIAGDPGTGKTYLCLNAVRNYQKKGYMVFYIDTEGAIDSTDYIKFGVDLDKLRYLRMGLISEVKFFVYDFIKTFKENPGMKMVLFVDSIGLLDTDKTGRDIEKGSNASDMGLKAKELRALFRSFTLELSNIKVPLIFTNHTYASMDQYTPKGASGGGGPEFSASVILMLAKGTLRDENKTRTGIIVRCDTHKNRFAKPIRIEFHISTTKGMNAFVGLQDYVSWDNCGVGRGIKLTEKEYNKLKPDEKDKCRQFEFEGTTYYYFPKALGKTYLIRHNCDNVPVAEYFTSRLFTQEVLQELDVNIIQPTFKFPDPGKELDEMEHAELNADLEVDVDADSDVEETVES